MHFQVSWGKWKVGRDFQLFFKINELCSFACFCGTYCYYVQFLTEIRCKASLSICITCHDFPYKSNLSLIKHNGIKSLQCSIQCRWFRLEFNFINCIRLEIFFPGTLATVKIYRKIITNPLAFIVPRCFFVNQKRKKQSYKTTRRRKPNVVESRINDNSLSWFAVACCKCTAFNHGSLLRLC